MVSKAIVKFTPTSYSLQAFWYFFLFYSVAFARILESTIYIHFFCPVNISGTTESECGDYLRPDRWATFCIRSHISYEEGGRQRERERKSVITVNKCRWYCADCTISLIHCAWTQIFHLEQCTIGREHVPLIHAKRKAMIIFYFIDDVAAYVIWFKYRLSFCILLPLCELWKRFFHHSSHMNSAHDTLLFLWWCCVDSCIFHSSNEIVCVQLTHVRLSAAHSLVCAVDTTTWKIVRIFLVINFHAIKVMQHFFYLWCLQFTSVWSKRAWATGEAGWIFGDAKLPHCIILNWVFSVFWWENTKKLRIALLPMFNQVNFFS